MLSVIAIFLLSIQSRLDWTRTQIALRYSYKIEQQTTNLAFSSSMSHSLKTNSANMQPLSDLVRLKATFSSPSIFDLFDAPFTPVFLLVMYLMYPMLGHFALVSALLLGFISIVSMYVTNKLKTNVSQGTGSLSTLTSDWLQNSDAIHALVMQDNLLKKWKKESINPTVDKTRSDTENRTITAIAKYLRMLLQIGILCTSVVLVLGNEELDANPSLLEKGYVSKVAFLELQREYSSLVACISEHKANIQKSQSKIAELMSIQESLRIVFKRSAQEQEQEQEQEQDILAEIQIIQKQISASKTLNDRIEIRDQVSCEVINISIHTRCGVIPPTSPVLK